MICSVRLKVYWEHYEILNFQIGYYLLKARLFGILPIVAIPGTLYELLISTTVLPGMPAKSRTGRTAISDRVSFLILLKVVLTYQVPGIGWYR